MKLPSYAYVAINVLLSHGYSAYFVGGAVRDLLMEKEAKDVDIATSALPKETEKCFLGYTTIETGIKHGTVTVLINRRPVEITTYRVDGGYRDNRHPEEVAFVDSLFEDLRRRDFTVNAMAMDAEGNVLDYFGGSEDLNRGIIRAVGAAEERFREDALRVMRAMRFSSKLGFTVEEATKAAVFTCSPLLVNISGERLYQELCGVLMGDNAVQVLTEYASVFTVFMPELAPIIGFEQHNPHHLYDVWRHTVLAIGAAPKNLYVRLALLFHDVGKAQAFFIGEDGHGHFYGHAGVSEELCRKVLSRFHVSNLTMETVCGLVKAHMTLLTPSRKLLLKLIAKLGKEKVPLLMDVVNADREATGIPRTAEDIDEMAQTASLFQQILEEDACFSLRQLAFNGQDLLALGIPQGRQVGEILNDLLSQVVDGKLENNRYRLRCYVLEKYNL